MRRLLAALGVAAVDAATVCEYFVAAEDVVWDCAPTRRDQVHGGRVPDPWRKTRYVECTDASFPTTKPQPEWLGILGPVLRAEVGDTIVVHFRDFARGHYGIHPHGVRYDKDNEVDLHSRTGTTRRCWPTGGGPTSSSSCRAA